MDWPTIGNESTAVLHNHAGGFPVLEETLELAAAQVLAFESLPLAVGDGDLEDGFCQINGGGHTGSHGLLLHWLAEGTTSSMAPGCRIGGRGRILSLLSVKRAAERDGVVNEDFLAVRQISRRGGNRSCQLDGDRVRISGSAVKYMEGTIEIPI
ncbi:MAG: hypothetical protein JJT90_18150 [Ectothiorhodospiraceae bacterium]|nr:hypothetical protein [Ectothiorhodospiraceae bacterium]